MHIFTIPNLLTICRLLLLPGVIVLSRQDRPIYCLALFLAIMATDALDGFLARRLNQQTALGGYLDPVVDKIVALALLYELAFAGLLPYAIPHLFLARELLANGIRAWAGTLGTIITANWMGKLKLFLETIVIAWGLLLPALVDSCGPSRMMTGFRATAVGVLVVAWSFLVAFAYRNRSLLVGRQ